MVGGVQAVNGAVYAPGTPEDLAASTGVSVAAATAAQQRVAQYVDFEPVVDPSHRFQVGLMQACYGTLACDHRIIAAANPPRPAAPSGTRCPPTSVTLQRRPR